MLEWFTGTIAGKFISTFFISMLPVVELRLGLPYGIALGLDYPLALTAAVLGNMLPVPFIILFIRQIFAWMRRHMPKLDGFVAKIESKAHLKGETVQKYGPLGLLIFVAIPLPGRGAGRGAAGHADAQGRAEHPARRAHRGRDHDGDHLRGHPYRRVRA